MQNVIPFNGQGDHEAALQLASHFVPVDGCLKAHKVIADLIYTEFRARMLNNTDPFLDFVL